MTRKRQLLLFAASLRCRMCRRLLRSCLAQARGLGDGCRRKLKGKNRENPR